LGFISVLVSLLIALLLHLFSFVLLLSGFIECSFCFNDEPSWVSIVT
jgi:hypothetical protein